MPRSVPVCVNVSNLSKNYGPVKAVRDVSFQLFPGEIFGLIGQNGAGKTTIIECLLGLRRPDNGTIAIKGVDMLTEPVRARQCVGAQLQSASLQDKITPNEALRLFASFYQQPVKIASLLAQFELTDKASEPFNSLSGGQKQRLFLALALLNNPEILILDEPTASLDPQARRTLHRSIAELKTAGRAVLMSTHNLEEASTLCDRIGILHEGRLIADATPVELIARARSNPRLSFRTIRPLEPSQVATLPGVTDHIKEGQTWRTTTTNVNQTISSLVHKLDTTGNEMVDLQILQPTLEDVFIELTGQVWTKDAKDTT
jgi:ABC-2 type transport system ATP-binding protein